MTRNRKTSIKQLIMNGSLIVGVGNIYASESLFMSKIRPSKPAKNITKKECTYLVSAIKQVLKDAIKFGGSSIRDFKQLDGSSGYFKIKHNVYGRESKDCYQCNTKIKKIIISGRSTFYCNFCQK
jgi:formamidopyrimidine-DNA glycosylase